MQARVKPAVLALPNQPSDQSDQHNQDQVPIDKEYKEKPTTQQLLPSLVLDPSAVLSIDTEEYYVDSSNVMETEEFGIEENEFTLDTFSTTDCSPSKQPRLMNTEARQRTVDCPIEPLPSIPVSITDHETSDTPLQVKAVSVNSDFHVSQLDIDIQQELNKHPNLAPNQLLG